MTGRQLALDLGVPDVAATRRVAVRATGGCPDLHGRVYLHRRGRLRRVRDVTVRLGGLL